MLASVNGFLFYFLTFSTVLIPGPFILLWSRITRDYTLPFRAVVWFNQAYFKLFGIRLEISGRENIDPDKAYLILSNHQSFLDIPVILSIRLLSFVSKIEIKKWPLFGKAMERMNCIFVNREDPESRKQVGPQMLVNMKRKISYCVFPEGTRTRDEKLLPFRLGIFRIARSSRLDILPVN